MELVVLLIRVDRQFNGISVELLEVLRRDVQIPVDHLTEEVLQLVQVDGWNASHASNVLIREVDVIVELGCYQHSRQNEPKIKQHAISKRKFKSHLNNEKPPKRLEQAASSVSLGPLGRTHTLSFPLL